MTIEEYEARFQQLSAELEAAGDLSGAATALWHAFQALLARTQKVEENGADKPH
jgi:hypothetical protein